MKTMIQWMFVLLLGWASLADAGHKVIHLHNDLQGSPVMATDEQGNVVWREEHKPYGEKFIKSPMAKNDVGYTGHQSEDDIGLVYMQQRFYDPLSGRFYSNDPKGFNPANIQSFNRYAYGKNNPYKYVDPDGRDSVMFYNNPQYQMAQPNAQATAGALSAAADFTPIIGDAKGIYDAYQNPSVTNISAAVIGVVPGAGDVAGKALKAVDNVVPNASQQKNIQRFVDKIPSNSKDSVELKQLPNGGVAAQATSPGNVLGSKAVYEKQIDSTGTTTQYTKTTYDPQGNIVHVKDKITNETIK